MEKALSECFGEVRPSLYGTPWVSVGAGVTNVNFSKGRAKIDFLPLGVEAAGSYHVTDLNIVLQSSRKPGPLPRLLLKSLLRIHWSNAEEKTQDEYTTRLLNELGRNG